MKRLKNRLIMMIENIKHLEKSKCFFRAQKGETYVYLGMGANSTRLVSILDGCSVLFSAHKKPNRRVQQKKVGDPTS
jgi:hypothetical protein